MTTSLAVLALLTLITGAPQQIDSTQQPKQYPHDILRNEDDVYDNKHDNLLGVELAPDLKVMIDRQGKGRADFVMTYKGHSARGPDIRVIHPLLARKPRFDEGPGRGPQYDFFASPDRRCLAVRRTFEKYFQVVYLYRRVGSKLVLVQPQGTRFDEAAARFLLASAGASQSQVNRGVQGPRPVNHVRWSTDGSELIIRLTTSSEWEIPLKRTIVIVFGEAAYNVKTGRFRDRTRQMQKEFRAHQHG